MNRIVAIAVTVVSMAICAYVQGSWSERWGTPATEQLIEWTARLENIPNSFGNWQGQAIEANEQELKASGARGAAGRAYKNKETGEVVSVFLVCGTARRVSTHTPDKCYVSHGFRMDRNPTTYEIPLEDGTTAKFFTAPFNKSDTISTTRLRILWTWSPDGNWIAPGNSATVKFQLSQYKTLFKLYVISETSSMDQPVHQTPCERFLQEFLPELNEVLFADDETGSGSSSTTAQRDADAASDRS